MKNAKLICILMIVALAYGCKKETTPASIVGTWTLQSKRYIKLNAGQIFSDTTYHRTHPDTIAFWLNGQFSANDLIPLDRGTYIQTGNYLIETNDPRFSFALTIDTLTDHNLVYSVVFYPSGLAIDIKDSIIYTFTR